MDFLPAAWGNPCPRAAPPPLVSRSTVDPTAHTQQPVVTGTSVLGIKYKDGIMLAADTLASYGSMAMFRSVERLAGFGQSTAIGVSGDISDWQQIRHWIDNEMISEYERNDGHQLHAENIYELLSRIMYNRRSQVNPLWNSLIVGGFRDGKQFLGYVDLQGTVYQSSTIATGFGAYLAQPLLRKAVEGRENILTETEAAEILDDALRVLFYRDTRAFNKVQRATVNASGVTITPPYMLKTEWGFAEKIRGYGVAYD